MIHKILEIKEKESFDFRKFAYPYDELSYLFPEWVAYYRLKSAICKAIQPQSILETGVRYGYSAITFLEAAKDASYLGIDNDSTTFGGSTSAIEWARKITEGYKAEFLITDTQAMTSFPGDFYDFIHIDAQQDGDGNGTFHDLEMALEKGRYILVDGYFWSKDNMLSATYFLEKYRKFIDYSIVIPGYAGELLIKTRAAAKHMFSSSREKRYDILERTYDASYYLSDCGGYDAFKRTGGRELEDARLLAVYYLANPQAGNNILDIGCGRGELSYAFSKSGAKVTGIDYSRDSIEIAQKLHREAEKEMPGIGLEFVQADFLAWNNEERFDRIVAADLVEHMEQASLERMFEKISAILKRGGLFVVHTSPNKLNYTYGYKKKREMAKQAGAYLPKNPRTYYEDLMHINEQTPATLRRTLGKYFPCVITWVTTLPDIAGSLIQSVTKSGLSNSTSIFAVASHTTIDKEELLSLTRQEKLDKQGLDAELFLREPELTMKKSDVQKLSVTVHNKSREKFASLPPYPVHIAYHWMNGKGEYEVFDGARTALKLPLSPGEKRDFDAVIYAPNKEGRYVLQISLVQEGTFWFEQILPAVPFEIMVNVI